MSNQKYVATSKPGSSVATVRKYGNSTTKTVQKSSLPKPVRDNLR